MKFTNSLINIAIDKANENDTNHKHGAVLYKGKSKFISGGSNSMRAYMNGEVFPSLHAEISCIVGSPLRKHPRAKSSTTKYNILVIRINGNGELRNSKPCYNCCSYITKNYPQIKCIVYSTAKQNFNSLDPRAVINYVFNFNNIDKINEIISLTVSKGWRDFKNELKKNKQLLPKC
jgi:hypothetical protein